MTFFSPNDELTAAFEDVQAKVDARVGQIADDFLVDLDMDVPLEVEEAFKVATAGGKRFRAFSAISGAAVGQAYVDAAKNPETNSSAPCSDIPAAATALLQAARKPGVLDLGAALEFYQGAALVHDDIIDRSDTRRGRPTVHVSMAHHHREEQFLGDDQAFGSDSAILVGDLLLAGAEFALASAAAALSGERAAALLRRYSLMAGEVAVGQYWDTSITYAPISSAVLPDGTPKGLERTLAVVRSKSARYSVVNPAVLGAIAVGAPADLLPRLESLLEPAGIAFQLRDDALGILGVEEETGKPTGIDIREGKRTVLLSLSLANAPQRDVARLEEIYSQDFLTDDEVVEASEVITSFGVPRHERMIEEYVALVNEQLLDTRLPGSARCLSQFLTHLLVTRSS